MKLIRKTVTSRLLDRCNGINIKNKKKAKVNDRNCGRELNETCKGDGFYLLQKDNFISHQIFNRFRENRERK